MQFWVLANILQEVVFNIASRSAEAKKEARSDVKSLLDNETLEQLAPAKLLQLGDERGDLGLRG